MTTDTTTEQEACGACGKVFDSLAAVFSHECEAIDTRHHVPHSTRPGDSIDPPESGGSGRSHSQPSKANRYPGNCIKCGGRVEAEQGWLVKDNSKQRGGTPWGVEHKIGECIENAEPTPVVARSNAMSVAQEGYLRSLLAERNPEADADEVVKILNDMPNPKSGASAMVDALKQLPKAPKPVKVTEEPEVDRRGDVHVIDGHYYRVHVAQRSGRLYACVWDEDTERFEYAPGWMGKLNASNKITAEQAAAFGHMFNRCCFCSREIDTPESTEVGYGPICASKQGLPWG